MWKTYTEDKKEERERIEMHERMELNEKVSFGRYKRLTYEQLCSVNIDYVRWCIDKSGMKDSITDELRYFYNKYSIQNV
jgi:hypothetical protein